MTEFMEQLTPVLIRIVCLFIIAGSSYLILLLRKKTAQLEKECENETAKKYIEMGYNAVAQSVAFTAQTFVDALKADNAFTTDRQLEAFNMAKEKALQILGDTAINALTNIYGDLDAWFNTAIEQECRKIK